MSIIIIWHNLANVHAFCSPTVPTRGNTFQSTFVARTFRVQSTWAFRWVFTPLHLTMFKISLSAEGSSVIMGTYLSFSSLQPRSLDFRTSEFNLFHSWSWRYIRKEWKWAAFFVGGTLLVLFWLVLHLYSYIFCIVDQLGYRIMTNNLAPALPHVYS